MCGIVGYLGHKPLVPVLVEGLRRLEYRGYDSAGIAVVRDGTVHVRRSPGKLSKLEEVLGREPVDGEFGIGHTRWATHGRPSEENAHPHRDCSGRIVVVHNGIVENYLELRQELTAQGHRFCTETDTEVVAHLVEREWRDDGLAAAVRRALTRLRGLFALVLISADDPGTIVAARNGPPVVIGMGEDEYFVASDIPAILAHTREIAFLDDQEMAVVTREGVAFTDFAGAAREKTPQHVAWDPVMAEKAGYRHFMLKEIFEQPLAVRETIIGRTSAETGHVFLEEMKLGADVLAGIDRVVILACGTSWHAGLVGKFLIEQIARVPVEVDYGSEFRYRRPIVDGRTLAVAITQSGETADTLGALREATRLGARSVAICNVVGSMVTREAEGTIYTHAGPEIGVASTKAFTTQLVALHLLALAIGQARGTTPEELSRALVRELDQLPIRIEEALQVNDAIEELSASIQNRRDCLYLGRGVNYPIALEGALKLKEISYIHAEGYPAGEMKHGPIALIEEDLPVIVLAADDGLFEKVVGNIQEAKARGGRIIAITTHGQAPALEQVLTGGQDAVLAVPDAHPLVLPVLMTVPVQLIAYHVAVRRGCDVDQPRNLAKSVTVE
ncbi:MAG: glutamine--fructose-6-phosphate transaminase (isomerizing) [Acidobacteriota bacterium]|jgi:glucosamine--fructose-6-phosphate aminotransferase (isomerizing)|nr:MAG: glutamine--fructose-6-phosphate transaminase (isomerizing) [Acidobacteriota bacterium]